MKTPVLLAAAALSLAGLASPATCHEPTVEPVAFFDPATGYPEGLAIDRDGECFLTSYFACRVKKVARDGTVTEIAAIDDWNLRGAKFGPRGDLYIAGGKGVWKVSRAGVATLFAEVPGHAFLNDLVFDRRGNLYVTDSFAYLIWKIDATGAATVWSTDALLQPASTFFPFPLGPNGLAFDDDERVLTVANSCAGRLVEIPVKRDGSAGTSRTFVEDERLIGADGITFNDRGELFVAANIQNQIVKVGRRGDVSVVAAGGLLSTPTAVVFGRGRDHDTLFICNNGDFFAGADAALQGLMQLDTDGRRHGHGDCR